MVRCRFRFCRPARRSGSSCWIIPQCGGSWIPILPSWMAQQDEYEPGWFPSSAALLWKTAVKGWVLFVLSRSIDWLIDSVFGPLIACLLDWLICQSLIVFCFLFTTYVSSPIPFNRRSQCIRVPMGHPSSHPPWRSWRTVLGERRVPHWLPVRWKLCITRFFSSISRCHGGVKRPSHHFIKSIPHHPSTDRLLERRTHFERRHSTLGPSTTTYPHSTIFSFKKKFSVLFWLSVKSRANVSCFLFFFHY